MAYRTILVELADDSGLEQRLQVARSLAKRLNAVLIGMHVMPRPFIPASYGEATAYLGPEIIEAQRKANREIAGRVQAIFRSVCGEGSKAIWQEAEGDRGDLLAEAARTTDLLIARHVKVDVTEAPDVLDQLVTATGVPVLALPSGFSGDLGQTVLVAWNGSREATRAVHDALPLLHEPKRVILSAVGDEAATTLEAAAAMLRRHGVAVQAHKVDELDGNAGEVLLAQAAAHAADVLVMGAYGHARLRELVFGGATRCVLHEATLPVLFSS
jgi:nucleotide-binding universal stress UspA family protein